MARYRALIIDDDPSVHIIAAKRLAAMGCDTYSAHDGAEGWQKVQDERPDLVLCDWMMPKLSGVDVCRRVKQDPELAGIYFIILTAKGQTGDRVAGLEAGADEFLTKPVDPAEFQARVKAGLRIIEHHRSLATLALTDSLTGLRNRRAFEEDLAREIARAARYRGCLSLIILDVDRFKEVNDRFGHDRGDELLRAVATTLVQDVRSGDTTYRIGGDEFAAILPHGKPARSALQSRIAHAVAGLQQFAVDGRPPSVSMGICANTPEAPLTAAEMIRRADQAMYQAKRSMKTGMSVQQAP